MSVSISSIKSTLGVSTNSLKALCQSSNVNKFSATKPGSTGYNSSGFTFVPPTNNFKMSSFKGYNHNIKTPFKSGTLTWLSPFGGNQGIWNFSIEIKYEVDSGGVNLYDIIGNGWKLKLVHSNVFNFSNESTFTSSTSQTLKANGIGPRVSATSIGIYLAKGDNTIVLPFNGTNLKYVSP